MIVGWQRREKKKYRKLKCWNYVKKKEHKMQKHEKDIIGKFM